ncbi:hypothetical protein [Nocardiopsis alborubida]|uniref:Uncharacterized protein n=1 Tax=Nocardiopsis alborubida TaxID=146802 RepID=A0A7X6MB71_9ACTN|nr:hypothetical protein [Nocardiopsis alborubida]NKY98193.1 hypothetical protein [Nocardiopsis alborubida]
MAESGRTSLGPIEQEWILQQIGGEILAVLGDGWREVKYTVNLIESYLEEDLEVVYGDREAEKGRAPLVVMQSVRKLRSGMYQESRGAWHGMRYTISPSGDYRAEYSYDEVDFDFSPSLEAFVQDLESFPRESEFIPGWLQLEIEQAGKG